MMMLLKQLIESPIASSKLVVCNPFQEPNHEDIVKEVVGLANADVEGPRNILFGVNPGALDGAGIVGITEAAVAELKKAHNTVSALIEPVLQLAFVFDRINGKLVGTLEIDGCDDPPYIVSQNSGGELVRGQCWIREDRELRDIQPSEVTAGKVEPEPEKKPRMNGKPPSFSVGFNGELDCMLLEVPVPDTSDPPFADEDYAAVQSSDQKQTIIEKIGTVTTRILGLGGANKKAPDDEGAISDTQIDAADSARAVLEGANDHYYYEEKAVHFNLCISNTGEESIEDVSVKLGFPRIAGMEVVERLYTSPFDKRSQQEIRNLGYPQVERRDKATMVRGTLERLAPDSPQPVFKSDLRLAVGPEMAGKKIAILYTLHDEDKQVLGEGRLKIKFGRIDA